MNLEALAEALVVTLAPALPYLVATGKVAAEKAVKEVGEAAWTKAKALWDRLGGAVAEKPAAAEAAEDVAAAPEREKARSALALQLEKILAGQPALAEELAALLASGGGGAGAQATVVGSGAIAQGQGSVAAGAGGIAIGGSVGGSVVRGAGAGRSGDVDFAAATRPARQPGPDGGEDDAPEHDLGGEG